MREGEGGVGAREGGVGAGEGGERCEKGRERWEKGREERARKGKREGEGEERGWTWVKGIAKGEG